MQEIFNMTEKELGSWAPKYPSHIWGNLKGAMIDLTVPHTRLEMITNPDINAHHHTFCSCTN